MAKGKYVKRKPKTKRTRRYRRRAVNVNRALKPFAQRYITSLKYSEALSLNVTLGVPNIYKFRLNSLFDPNLTGVGHQPYGYDQLTPIPYNRYRVISCYYIVSTVTASNYLQTCVIATNAAPGFTSVDHMRESPRAHYRLQSPGSPIIPIKGRVYLPSLTGRTKSQYMADDRYQAVYNENPLESCVLEIGTAPVGSDAQTFGYALNITLIYNVELFDIEQFDQS